MACLLSVAALCLTSNDNDENDCGGVACVCLNVIVAFASCLVCRFSGFGSGAFLSLFLLRRVTFHFVPHPVMDLRINVKR